MDAERLRVRWDRNAQGMGRAIVVGERLPKNQGRNCQSQKLSYDRTAYSLNKFKAIVNMAGRLLLGGAK